MYFLLSISPIQHPERLISTKRLETSCFSRLRREVRYKRSLWNFLYVVYWNTQTELSYLHGSHDPMIRPSCIPILNIFPTEDCGPLRWGNMSKTKVNVEEYFMYWRFFFTEFDFLLRVRWIDFVFKSRIYKHVVFLYIIVFLRLILQNLMKFQYIKFSMFSK